MKRWILITILVSILTSNITGYIAIKNTRQEMILTAIPDFEAHTIEWNGEVHEYE